MEQWSERANRSTSLLSPSGLICDLRFAIGHLLQSSVGAESKHSDIESTDRIKMSGSFKSSVFSVPLWFNHNGVAPRSRSVVLTLMTP